MTTERNNFVFPYEIEDVDYETNQRLLRDFTGERTGYVLIGPKKYCLPAKYKQYAADMYNFKSRPSDVWVATFPRSGTTWTQEMVWLIANDLDFKRASDTSLLLRFPFFEYNLFLHPDVKAELIEENKHDPEKLQIVHDMDVRMWDEFANMQEQRFIKTHLPFSLLPPDLLQAGGKIIYVARNPKDVAVSYYHLNHTMRTQGYSKDFPTYWDYFENNLQPWTPYWEHIIEGLEKRHEKNMLFLFYEDINKNLRANLRKIGEFLGKSLDETQLNQLEEHLDIKNFKNNPSVNFDLLGKVGVLVKNTQGFVREGKVGKSTDMYEGSLQARFDKWYEANSHGIDIQFPK